MKGKTSKLQRQIDSAKRSLMLLPKWLRETPKPHRGLRHARKERGE